MNYCTICGAQLSQASVFCPQCGLKVMAGDVQQGKKNNDEKQQCANIMAKSFLSSSFLIICIISSITIALNILSGILTFVISPNSIISELQNLAYWVGWSIGYLGTILYMSVMCAALWKCRIAAKSSLLSGNYSPKGLNLYRICVKALLIILYILLVLSCLFLFFSSLSIFSEMNELSYPNDPMFLIIVVSIVLVTVAMIALILNIVFQHKLLRTIKAMINSANTGMPTAYVSSYVIVISYICAGFALLVLLAGLYILALGDGSIVEIIAVMVTILNNLVFATWLNNYKKDMKALVYSNNTQQQI